MTPRETMSAATFVRAALLEVGHGDLVSFIDTNRGGFPAFRWRQMDREPTRAEVDATFRAFDLWYRTFAPVMPEGAQWDGYSPAAVDRWLDLIQAVRPRP